MAIRKDWTSQEIHHSAFDDFRQGRRLEEVVGCLSKHLSQLYPEASCEIALLSAEWKLLRRKFEPKNRSKQPPNLHQAVGWIARLGGFLARKNDGEPGLKTIWRGIGVLHHLLGGSQLTHKT